MTGVMAVTLANVETDFNAGGAVDAADRELHPESAGVFRLPLT